MRLNQDYTQTLKKEMDAKAQGIFRLQGTTPEEQKESLLELKEEFEQRFGKEVSNIKNELQQVYNHVHLGTAFPVLKNLNTSFFREVAAIGTTRFTPEVLEKHFEDACNELQEKSFKNVVDSINNFLQVL